MPPLARATAAGATTPTLIETTRSYTHASSGSMKLSLYTFGDLGVPPRFSISSAKRII
jgi:hypothetical protein